MPTEDVAQSNDTSLLTTLREGEKYVVTNMLTGMDKNNESKIFFQKY